MAKKKKKWVKVSKHWVNTIKLNVALWTLGVSEHVFKFRSIDKGVNIFQPCCRDNIEEW